jgi:uncharacterized protein (TIGR00290 family)
MMLEPVTRPTRRILLSWSGGKDCTLALTALRSDESVEVVGLLTTVTGVHERISMHGVRRDILHAQARSLGLPVIEARIEPGATNESYDEAWGAGFRTASAQLGPIAGVAFGDLFLEDVRAFREAQAARHGYEPLFPLWGRDTAGLAREFIAAGFEAYLSCVDTQQIDASFAGRRFDAALLADLPPTADPCGERGEFHTCVVAGPSFRAAIDVTLGERVRRDGRFEFCDILARGALVTRPGGSRESETP